jgi:4-hydroxyphenylacetate 3-monooxygenase
MAARDGAAYLADLRDGREIWLDGERVADVTAHPGLGRAAHSIAALYDLQCRPELREQMTYRSPSSGDPVGLSFVEPRSLDDLIRRRQMFQVWADYGCGMLGRAPDYMNALLMGCAANRTYFEQAGPRAGERIVAYYEHCRERDLCLTHTFGTPQRDRSTPYGDDSDDDKVSLRIVDENADGLIVRGARILATLAPYSDELLVLPSPSRSYHGQFSPQALAVAVPVAAPGLKFICRESFDLGRSAYDHPLGSRFEEMDAVAVFDDVLVPWERVFIHRDVGLCGGLFRDTNTFLHPIHQFMVKNVTKAEFVLGIATLLTRTIKTEVHFHIQTLLGELVNAVETVRAYVRAAEADAAPDASGVYVPSKNILLTARSYFPTVYPRLIEILQLLGSSGLMAIPSEAMLTSEVGADVETFFQSTNLGGAERVKLFRLAWDVACSAFGQRQVLYERFFAGDPMRNLSSHYLNYDTTRAVGLVQALLQREGIQLPVDSAVGG